MATIDLSQLITADAKVAAARAELVEQFRVEIKCHVDAVAISRRYDSAVSLASYVASNNPAWAAEAQAFVAWRDAVWAYAYTEMDKVLDGQRGQPGIAEFIGELPAIEWPEEGE
ncbi:hypothetical protein MIC97_08655 [Aquamicrobium sp. NLF2-7]|uniref:hypothetical protein n=1 Tax=unclassified Aquamicrobium TaxID=2618194 RepID=UPI001EFBDF88|nr:MULTISPECIES: hypothetical protein [unclassified Aquamicrobium]MCG8271571.1 hypothetical protein [Aquamicrobium sp. NLF2-7]MCK9550649.1 hypothetical protein [Aquamicrobium sp.]